MWYCVKVLRIRYNLFAGTETLSLSVYEPITIHILLGGGGEGWVTVPQFGGGDRPRGRLCHPLKFLCSRYNLFAGNDTLSLSVFEPIAKTKFGWGTFPKIWLKG